MRQIRTILLEDNRLNQQLLTYLLENRGHHVITFDNPSICPLQLNKECRCNENERCTDILISDLNMPVISGLEYIQNQRKKGCKCKKVALVSNDINRTVLKKARKLSCKVFTKPYQINELLSWLDDFENSFNGNIQLSDWYKN